MLWVALHLPCLPAGTLERIAAWACQFTPKVSLEPPQDLLLEVEASLRLFGGRERIEKRLREDLAAMGLPARLAAARHARAALWLARGEGSAIDGLPLSVIRTNEEAERFLRGIGISTVGELLRLPREGLARRCGVRLLAELDRALGAAPEPRTFFDPPARFDAALELPSEVTHAEGILFSARRLLVQLEGLLAARHAGVYAIALSLLHREGQTRLEISASSPARQAERLGQLLRDRLARVSLARPVEAIRIEAQDFVPLHERSRDLFRDQGAESEEWARLLERLQARLGSEAVYGLAVSADHRPERAWRRTSELDNDHGQPRTASGERPLWLVDPPRRLREQAFELLAGPERIESGWWDGEEAKRDYFIARLGDASLAWIYRETGEWFLHGFFA
jgi:protein ImuB